MVKHFCDNCEKALDGGPWVRVEYKLTDVNSNSNLVQESRKHFSDLCPECYKQCMKILNGGNKDD